MRPPRFCVSYNPHGGILLRDSERPNAVPMVPCWTIWEANPDGTPNRGAGAGNFPTRESAEADVRRMRAELVRRRPGFIGDDGLVLCSRCKGPDDEPYEPQPGDDWCSVCDHDVISA